MTKHILLDILRNGIHQVKIPKAQLKKYEVLLDFYKNILLDKNIANELNETYIAYITNKKNKKEIMANGNFDNIMQMDPVEMLLNMKPSDMKE